MAMKLKNGSEMQDERQEALLRRMLSERVHINSVYPHDEIGMADLFIDLYRDTLRYCPENRTWYTWKVNHWTVQGFDGDATGFLTELLRLLRVYCDEVGLEDDSEYVDYVKKTSKAQSIKNVLSLVKNLQECWIRASQLNLSPWILNTPNAAYDLRTGDVCTNTRQYNLTKVTPVGKRIDGVTPTCNRWYEFIDEIMQGDPIKAAFLQRALGYSILGSNREECMFVAYGPSARNGKGTLFSTIEAALGHDYCSAVSPKLICEIKAGVPQDYNAPQPALAKLVGVRLALMSESSKEDRIDAAALKTITGRDELMTRQLYGQPFTFTPQFTMWLNTNHLPMINDVSVFNSNRIWVIEFNRHFSKEEQDADLKDILQDPDNLQTVLEWLIDGAIAYYQYGLIIPDCVQEATRRYAQQHDRIGAFLDECCEIDFDSMTPRGDVYSRYCAWCHKGENRFSPMGSTAFYSEMASRGYHTKHRNDGRYLEGVKLK